MVYWLVNRFDGNTTVGMGPVLPQGVTAVPRKEAEKRMREQLEYESRLGKLEASSVERIMRDLFE